MRKEGVRHFVSELGVGSEIKRECASTTNYMFILYFLLNIANILVSYIFCVCIPNRNLLTNSIYYQVYQLPDSIHLHKKTMAYPSLTVFSLVLFSLTVFLNPPPFFSHNWIRDLTFLSQPNLIFLVKIMCYV